MAGGHIPGGARRFFRPARRSMSGRRAGFERDLRRGSPLGGADRNDRTVALARRETRIGGGDEAVWCHRWQPLAVRPVKMIPAKLAKLAQAPRRSCKALAARAREVHLPAMV